MKPCKLGCLPILTYSLPSIHPSILPLSMCPRLNLAFTYIDLCISPSIFLEKIHLENEGSSQPHGVSRGGCLPAPVHWLVAILSDLPLDIATPDRSAHVPWKCIKSGAKKGILRTYDLKTFFFFAISCLSFRNPQAPFQKSTQKQTSLLRCVGFTRHRKTPSWRGRNPRGHVEHHPLRPWLQLFKTGP